MIAIAAGVLMWTSNRKAQYSNAVAALNQQDYSKAISLFEDLNGFRDSAEKLQESHYQLGTAHLAAGNYDAAKSEFDQAGKVSGYFTLYGDNGYPSWYSSNDSYSSGYAEILTEATQRAKTELVLVPSASGDNYYLQYDIPSYVFDNGLQVTICFRIGQNTFIYTGDIDRNEMWL